jgi:hypothetical protein
VKRQALIAVVLVSAVAAAGCAPRPHPGHAPVSWPPAPPASADTGNGPNAPMTITPPAAATDVVLRFVHAWARPGLDQQVWYAGVRGLATPAYARMLATVDPANVPAHLVTGALVVRASTPQELIADVPTDAGTVRVTAVPAGGRWLVATVSGTGPR